MIVSPETSKTNQNCTCKTSRAGDLEHQYPNTRRLHETMTTDERWNETHIYSKRKKDRSQCLLLFKVKLEAGTPCNTPKARQITFRAKWMLIKFSCVHTSKQQESMQQFKPKCIKSSHQQKSEEHLKVVSNQK